MSLLLSRPDTPAEPAPATTRRDPSWFGRWGRSMYRRRRLVLGLTGVLLVIAGVWGTSVFGALSSGGFEDPDSESAQAAALIDDQFGHLGADVVVVYQAPEGSSLQVTDPAFRQAVESALASVPPADVKQVSTYWSSDGRRTS
jgi:RND superfamily putative drug exporter